ncbi:MAG: metal-dependent transcriptional regulator [Bacilli bacterium]|nr:metal-dependent transcriptional regulator [Bacilli bacterium]
MYNKKESTEDYLENILMAQKELGPIRAIELAKYIGFTKASVSVALKKLKEQESITVDQDTGIINLTEKGRALAEKTFERHTILTKSLICLGVNPVIAERDACKVEHLLSEESFEAIKNHIK